MELIIISNDQSPSYTYGVEFGRILAKMELGIEVISNGGFPVRLENVPVLISACKVYGYKARFGSRSKCGDWQEFTATKAVRLN